MANTIATGGLQLNEFTKIGGILNADVLFVCGVYKSGTSLATAKLEAAGFCSTVNGASEGERGYATNGARYPTRECAETRRINDLLGGFSTSQQQVIGIRKAEAFLSSAPGNVVLKDPRFVLHLPVWLRVAERVGRRPAVVFTSRKFSLIRQAWNQAPFTASLSRAGLLSEMIDAQFVSHEIARSLAVPTAYFALTRTLSDETIGTEHD